MKDDIEYLTGENKELMLKCKEVCMTKASLQLQLAQARRQLEMQHERQEMSAIVDEATQLNNRVDASDIETARNIGFEDEIFAPVPESKEDDSRIPDQRGLKEYLSDHDSAIDIVNQMDEDNILDMSGGPQQTRKQLEQCEAQIREL